jgi:hypothetical protein
MPGISTGTGGISLNKLSGAVGVGALAAIALEKCKQAGWLCNEDEGVERHHIVAQGSNNEYALIARDIMEASNVGINSQANLVDIPYRVHRRLHTNTYYATVAAELQAVYNDDATEQQNHDAVIGRLEAIGELIQSGVFPS